MIISVLFRISWNSSIKNFASSIIWLPCKARKILHRFLLSVFRAIRWCPGDSVGFFLILLFVRWVSIFCNYSFRYSCCPWLVQWKHLLVDPCVFWHFPYYSLMASLVTTPGISQFPRLISFISCSKPRLSLF